jgi:hypothetical protein
VQSSLVRFRPVVWFECETPLDDLSFGHDSKSTLNPKPYTPNPQPFDDFAFGHDS